MTEPLLAWDDSFLIGIGVLDFEHRSLIEDISRLHRELSGHRDKPEIERCLGEIFARMQAHFALEERVMLENDYAGYAAHKREHEDLLDSFTADMLKVLNAPDLDSSGLVEDDLRRWIIDHILSSDKRMSAMIGMGSE